MPTKLLDPATAGTVNRVRAGVGFGSADTCQATLDNRHSARALRADLVDAHTIVCAGFASCAGSSPVLDLCRRLIAAGIDPATPLEAYRGDTLCLYVRTIAEAAGFEINGDGNGFRPLRKPDAAPPMRENGGAV
jgi:hypothetical protein